MAVMMIKLDNIHTVCSTKYPSRNLSPFLRIDVSQDNFLREEGMVVLNAQVEGEQGRWPYSSWGDAVKQC